MTALLLVSILLLSVSLGALALLHVGTAAIGASSHGGGPPPTAVVGTYPTPIQHVFVVVLENQRVADVLANGTYERYLASTYARASQYYAICHPSAPNYLAMTSGAPWQCGSDAWNVVNTTNLGDLLERANRSWKAYVQSMPSPCDTNNSYPYAVKHNPFVYYADIVNNTARCRAHDVNFTAWSTDLASGTLPNFALITPNLLNDGHDTSLKTGDTWLRAWLEPMINSSLFASSAVFVVYDESVNDDGGYNGTAGGGVYLTAVSPFARAGYGLPVNASHYNLLSTVEWLLALGSCGHRDGTPGYPPMAGLFEFPHTSTLAGTVSSGVSQAPIPGATVRLTAAVNATTDAYGRYWLNASNGTYNVSVSAAGYLSQYTDVTIAGAPAWRNWSLDPKPPPDYSVSGTLAATATDRPIVGGNVSVYGGPSVPTNASGGFRFALVNGSYLLNASASGYTSLNVPVRVSGAAVTLAIALNATPTPAVPSPLSVAVSASPSPVLPGALVQFSASAAGGTPPYTAQWTFGDGSRASGLSITHAYATTGSFHVTMVLNDAKQKSVDAAVLVVVNSASVPGNLSGPGPGPSAPASLPLWAVAALVASGAVGAGVAAIGVWRLRHR